MSWRFIISVIIASYETNSRFIAQKRLYILSLPPFSFHFCLFILLFLLMHLFPSTNLFPSPSASFLPLLQHLSPSTSAPFTFYSTSAPFLLLLQHLFSFYFSTFSPSTSTPYLLLLQTFSPSTSAPFLLLLQHLFHSTY